MSARTLPLTARLTLPDVSNAAEVGYGYPSTGAALDAVDFTFWGSYGLASASSSAGVVHLSADLTTVLATYTSESLGLPPGSAQGVAYDRSDDTVWYILKATSTGAYLVHITKDGSLLGSTRLADGKSNGLAYDSLRDQLIISNDNANVSWVDKGTLVKTGKGFTAAGANNDQLSYDATRDELLISAGRNGVSGTVKRYDVSNVDAVLVETITLAGADAIEGIVLYGHDYLVWNDAKTHPGDPAVNGVLIYSGVTGEPTPLGSLLDSSFADEVIGDARVNTLYGGQGNDLLYGLANNDLLDGGSGDDLLDGGAGADGMTGGAGDDIYVVDVMFDQVLELDNDGMDTIVSTVSLTLAANVENLTLKGDAVTASGNMLDNLIIGNGVDNILSGSAGNDTLDGGAGNDTMIGGTGSDSYVVDSSGDVVIEQPNDGADLVRTALTSHVLATNVEDLTYFGAGGFTGTGNAVANTITGGASKDKLDGKSGADTLIGLAGDDSYIVDDVGDLVVEAAGGGADGVVASVTYVLGANIENLTLSGSSAISGLGNDLNNRIKGNAGHNDLFGFEGNDVLDGGNGSDRLYGGSGDDTYYVSREEDKAIEFAGEGRDTVFSDALTFTLDANVENLTLVAVKAITGIGNDDDNVISGNASANTLVGEDGADLLDGKTGADEMIGGSGADTYVVDNAGDRVVEAIGEGGDTVRTSLVSYTLGDGVENLVYTGSSAFSGIGNDDANSIIGGSGNDTLDGQAGADALNGGGGDDTYVVDSAFDDIIDSAGTDIVRTALDALTLAAGLEELVYIGQSDFTGTGNASANSITGGSGADRINGGLGGDVMIGLGGDDRYIVDESADLVIEADANGIDTVETALSAYTIPLNVETLVYMGGGNFIGIGNAAANALYGGLAADLLDGGAGADLMVGGKGNDTYVVDNVGDFITELTERAGGVDTVETTLSAYTLKNGLENLVFTGSGNFVVRGNDAANALTGGNGDDSLDGGGGADQMTGFGGDDVYYVSNAADLVIEAVDQGNDRTVSALVSYTLTSDVEVLQLVGNAATGVGNGGANTLIGNAKANTLDGAAGMDILTGGAGNDTFVFRFGEGDNDRVSDFAGAGALSGDRLQLVGFGENASISQVGSTDSYIIEGSLGSEIIQLLGVFDLNTNTGSNDYYFGGAAPSYFYG
ncbi:calcium-binding protein [Sphingomonas montana]|uniref:calcium-binding protein n=1 Tax=Sphingomonas montana TaxID=1843236 RepID=UPI00101AED3A|nr:calcium-binding protein [Sphingomonas montana]